MSEPAGRPSTQPRGSWAAVEGRRGGAHHPLIELTLARVREFIREPEAIFWTFGFPIVISLALALAFPSDATRPVVIGVAPGADTERLRAALAATAGVNVRGVPA